MVDVAAHRVKVGVLLATPTADLGEWLADAAAFDAAGADAIWVSPEPTDLDMPTLTAALATVTHRARLVVALPDASSNVVDTIQRLSRDRLVSNAQESGRWIAVPVPDGRASWRATLVDAAEQGVSGVVVAADPRLLDILRNPHDPDERPDLQLAQG
ncbi:hypothetical protein DMH04_14135 [Kibdelosporangium aridum]|uniref:LLM class flavin-dependent oxidoreductase n=1 Tax=Kibdelosporangium aridum TaxID=2030 RepID=A0A428ZDZ0_KIBAR|nr:hypothetical protein [Kibdelosporangium aridum]RSM86302.1 hypothetical protein DMH04_14135 [Kibdelosporangium aridum]